MQFSSSINGKALLAGCNLLFSSPNFEAHLFRNSLMTNVHVNIGETSGQDAKVGCFFWITYQPRGTDSIVGGWVSENNTLYNAKLNAVIFIVHLP